MTNKKWTEVTIATEIMKLANQFDPPRMPSNSETVEMYGSCGLSNAISKNGGYRYWAKKLGLEHAYSETKVGVQGEAFIADELRSMGFDVQTTSARFPYDLLIDGCVKVDVKSANTSYIRGCPIHAFRLAKRQQTCDIYIFYEIDTGAVYVVPAHIIHGQVQVEMGLDSKMYRPYKDAYALITELSNAYKSMC